MVENLEPDLIEHHAIAYTEHDPISISFDAEFEAQAKLEN